MDSSDDDDAPKLVTVLTPWAFNFLPMCYTPDNEYILKKVYSNVQISYSLVMMPGVEAPICCLPRKTTADHPTN